MLLLIGCSQAAPPVEERQKGEGPERMAQFLAQGTSVEDEVGEAMANGGVYVVAPTNGARELAHRPSPWAARERSRQSDLGGRASGYR
jgi:hypothetical protein